MPPCVVIVGVLYSHPENARQRDSELPSSRSCFYPGYQSYTCRRSVLKNMSFAAKFPVHSPPRGRVTGFLGLAYGTRVRAPAAGAAAQWKQAPFEFSSSPTKFSRTGLRHLFGASEGMHAATAVQSAAAAVVRANYVEL